MQKVTDEQIIYCCHNCKSAREAADILGIHVSSFIKRAKKTGYYDILLNKHNKQRRYTVNDHAFSIMQYDVAYWLGYIAADGSIVGNKLKFCIQRYDKNQLIRFTEFLKSDYQVNDHIAHYKDECGNIHNFDACNLSITSDEIVKDLQNYGIIQGKKYKDINFISRIPPEYRLEFIFGLFDGDGSISFGSTYNALTICSTHSMTDDIILELKEYRIDGHIRHRKDIDVIYIQDKESIVNFYNKYKYGYRLERKLNKFRNYLG